MNYEVIGEHERRTRNALAPVHFASIRDGFSLIGYGDLGKQILNDVTGLLAQCWSNHTDKPVRLNHQTILTDIELRPYKLQYVVPRLVVQKKPYHRQTLQTEDLGKPHVERLILRGIHKHAQMLGINVPASLAVEFVGCASNFAARLGHGGASLAGMRDACFEINASLKGYWTMGYITSKGYGLLNANLARGGKGDAPFQ
jgi:hypothetical protein